MWKKKLLQLLRVLGIAAAVMALLILVNVRSSNSGQRAEKGGERG